MDVKLINPFVASVGRVFDTMVKLPVTMARPHLLDRGQSTERVFDLAVVVDLAGGAEGLVALRMPKALARALVTAITGPPADGQEMTDADLFDGMAEIANMIVGGAKKEIAGDLIKVRMPRVIKSREVAYPIKTTGLVIPFETGGGRLLLEAVFRQNKPMSATPAAVPAEASATPRAAGEPVTDAPVAAAEAPVAVDAPAVAAPASTPPETEKERAAA